MLINRFFILFINLYQKSLGYMIGGRCRFYPSCSHYGLQVFQAYPWPKALGLTLKRLFKCHPLHPGGVDLPPKKDIHV